MTIEFDSNGHAIGSGVAHVYHFDSVTGEYLGDSDENIPDGVSIPGSTTLIAPPSVEKGSVATWDGSKWIISEDHRGETVYSTKNRFQSVINYIGPIKEGFTLLQPSTQFDEWDGSKWVTDVASQHTADVQSAESKKQSLLDLATQKIAPLQDAVDLEIATDDEKTQLTAWKKYRVLVNRVDTSKAPDITWPDQPTE